MNQNGHRGVGNSEDRKAQAGASAPQPRLEFNAQDYVAYVDDMDLTQEEAETLLRALWDIMMAFVDMGFGIHPVQEKAGDKNAETLKNTGLSAQSVLYSDHSSLIENTKTARGRPSAESESES